MSRTARLLLVSFLVVGLSACHHESSSPESARPGASRADSASSAGATADGREALMHVAFPRWDGKHPWVLEVPGSDPKDGPATVTVAASPQLVLAIDDAHRVLVLAGVPSDDDGTELGGHPARGSLGAVWFARRDGHWQRAGQQDSILWAGFFGNIGQLKRVDLGAGHEAVSVENGSCWQGFCEDFLSLVGFDAERAGVLVSNLAVMSSSIGGTQGCDEALSGGAPDPQQDAASPNADNCFDVSGKWRIQPRAGAERGDLVVAYAGSELVAAADGATFSPRKIDGTLVLRYADGVYKEVSGRNPTHSL